jgi:stress-induced morphogen
MLASYEKKIREAFPGAEFKLTDQGGGDHLHLWIRAPQFVGIDRVKQHRMIFEIFSEEIKGPIHALAIDSGPKE